MLWNDNQPSKPGGYETIRQLSEIDGVRCPHCGAPTVLGVGLALLVETRVGEAHSTTFNSWVSR